MRRLIARLFSLEIPREAPPPPSAPPPSPAARAARAAQRLKRQLELESRVDFLEGEVNKLRGKLTGGLAHKPKPEEPAESRHDAPGATIAPEAVPTPAPDRWMALASHRRAKNGVLPG